MDNSPLTRAYISLTNLDHNMGLLSEITGGIPLWPAVKANAYGHSASIIAEQLAKIGYTTLCVAHAAEALALETHGINTKFIILSPDLGDTAEIIAERGFEPAVATFQQMEALSAAAAACCRITRIHIKLDTGMGRIGFTPEQVVEAVTKAQNLPGIKPVAVMSHFPRADEQDRAYSLKQIKRFRDAADKVRPLGINTFHIANSAAIFGLPESHMDLCRPGIAIYGLSPSQTVLHPRMKELRPVLNWTTRITQLKEVPAGRGLSYGHIFTTKRQSLIATIPLGYGDGLSRLLSNKMDLIIRGKRCPQVGRICMDQCMIDVTELRGTVEQGDEAIIIGQQEAEKITAEELATKIGTINYEIVTHITERVPRIAVEK